MALASTMRFDQMTLEVEWTAASGTYAKVCGLVDVEVKYTSETAESQIPDCDDETLPHTIIRTTVSTDWSATASGTWASSSHENIFQWKKTGVAKNVRLVYSAAAVGDVEFVSGPALLTELTHTRAKGQVVTAALSIVAAGAVTTTDQA